MIETTGDIFDYLTDQDTDAICIFTNGIVDKYGQAIAGAGQAGAAAQRWWNFKYNLGGRIATNGNVVATLGNVTFFENKEKIKQESTMLGSMVKTCTDNPFIPANTEFVATKWQELGGAYDKHWVGAYIVSFPTKNHYKNPADLKLIEQSAKDLKALCDTMKWKKVILGRAGCGKYTGRLDYITQVKPVIKDILDDRFIIVTLKE